MRHPKLSRSVSSIDIPPSESVDGPIWSDAGKLRKRESVAQLVFGVFRVLRRSGNRGVKRLFVLISLNVAYSTTEFLIGLFSGRVGLVSDAFRLTFGCDLLTFSLFAMATSRRKLDGIYTYRYNLFHYSCDKSPVFLYLISTNGIR